VFHQTVGWIDKVNRFNWIARQARIGSDPTVRLDNRGDRSVSYFIPCGVESWRFERAQKDDCPDKSAGSPHGIALI
jgi:hypothetical protein